MATAVVAHDAPRSQGALPFPGAALCATRHNQRWRMPQRHHCGGTEGRGGGGIHAADCWELGGVLRTLQLQRMFRQGGH